LILFGFLTSGRATTKDLDVLQVGQHCDSLLTILLERFGVSSEYARANEIYLESVNVGLPPVPSWYANRSQEFLPGTWSVLRVWQMKIHDLATTKLKRFSAKDRADLRELCDQGLLAPEALLRSLAKAFLWSTVKDGEPNDPDHAKAETHLGMVIAYLEGRISDL